jgi:hypothetical protein
LNTQVGNAGASVMQRSKLFLASMIAVLVAFGGISSGSAASAATAEPSGQAVTGAWQHHHVNFSYYGITALYSCDGLENNIRSLLLHLGARKDAKVSARGCPNGPSVPGHNAIIDTDFYTLSPSSDANGTVQAQWMPVLVSPTHPYFMSHGDCELIDEMKDLISKNFSLRAVDYRTDCVPHQVNIDDFSIKAQALKELAPSLSKAAKGY